MPRPLIFRSALLVAGSLSFSPHGHADSVTLRPDRDTSIFQNNVNNSDGGGPGFFAGGNGQTSPRRSLISFDVSTLPAGATITNVQLTLTLGQASTAPSGTIHIFDLTRNWGEGTAGSTATTIGGTGQGFGAGTGDATWNAAGFSSTAWTTAGGDHAATTSGSLTGTNTLNTTWTAPSTPQLVFDVQGWYNSPGTNFGWELINPSETTANTIFGFYSREWDDAHFGGSSSQVPALQVTYTVAAVPEPAGAVLTALAALSLLPMRFRWRA